MSSSISNIFLVNSAKSILNILDFSRGRLILVGFFLNDKIFDIFLSKSRIYIVICLIIVYGFGKFPRY